jgi:hypothetical protein
VRDEEAAVHARGLASAHQRRHVGAVEREDGRPLAHAERAGVLFALIRRGRRDQVVVCNTQVHQRRGGRTGAQ